MPEQPLDNDWVRRTTAAVAKGDRAALAVLYEAWFDRCYSMARSITRRDEAFCLDVVQDAFLRVIRAMRGLESCEQLEAWMSRTVHTAALDLLRKDSRRLRREVARGRGEVAADAGATDDAIAWVVAKLAEMPDRSLVGLRVGKGRSLDAVGAAAGMTGDAAHGRIRRALVRLRRMGREAGHGQ